jgi:hypothetical protein
MRSQPFSIGWQFRLALPSWKGTLEPALDRACGEINADLPKFLGEHSVGDRSRHPARYKMLTALQDESPPLTIQDSFSRATPNFNFGNNRMNHPAVQRVERQSKNRQIFRYSMASK